MSQELAKYIDHTQLKADTTEDVIEKLLSEAKKYEFASVCINPTWVAKSYEALKNTPVKVCTVIGFPLGASASAVKAFETKQAIQDGATEVDMVINIGELKAGNDKFVQEDIQAVVEAASDKALTKVIIETALLTDEEKVRACERAKAAGADFVKTSTGFSTGGATIEDVQLMRKTVGENIGVKASGGIRDKETMEAMLKAGANRIGASAGVSIVQGIEGTESY